MGVQVRPWLKHGLELEGDIHAFVWEVGLSWQELSV